MVLEGGGCECVRDIVTFNIQWIQEEGMQSSLSGLKHRSSGSDWKNLSAVLETRVQSLAREDPLEKGVASHSIILAWRIPWTEEPGWLQPIGSHRVGHDWATHTETQDDSLRWDLVPRLWTATVRAASGTDGWDACDPVVLHRLSSFASCVFCTSSEKGTEL